MKQRSAIVLYGTETGAAQDVAEELGRMVERLRFASHVTDLDSIEPSALASYDVALFAVSTTGQGEMPSNSRTFWKKLLRKKLPSSYLEHVHFALFGLGDSSYAKFNWAARKLHKRLVQLGGVEVCAAGEGDGQHPEGHDTMFIPWLATLCQNLIDVFPLEPGVEPMAENMIPPPLWELALVQSENDGQTLVMNGSSLSSEVKLATRKDEPWMASLHHDVGVQCDVVLTQNLRVTPLDHWQDVRHFSFLAEGHHPYLPGDVLMIHPENAVEEVDQILQLMGWTDIADCKVRFIQTKTAMPFQPRPPIAGINAEYGTTLRDILMRYLDLNAIPRRSFFAFIFQFTKDEFQKQRLIEFTSPEYIDELYDYTTRPRRSVLEVLQEFDTVKIPWQLAASVLPPLRGRQFSIASGGHLKAGLGGSTRFELLIALVKYKTVIRKVRQGVCTRYLAALSPGTKLLVTLQRGGLGISESDMAKPMVMIGPGTGVAPIRALLWEKLAWEEKLHLGGTANLGQLVPTGENVLFFGCRNQRADYFFQIDWNELKPKLPMQIFVAFSRDQGQKRYVQDVLTEQRQLVFRLLHDSGGIVFICGSSGRMPQAVREALLQSFQEFGKFDRPEAEKYLALMEREGRYKQETW